MKNSVIMATYNGEKYIIEQLDSIKNQTLPPDEVIICDDCSIDNTSGIVEDYISRYGLTGWHLFKNAENIGFYDNFFKALRLCTGDVIYLSDQDDVWDLDKIKVFTTHYNANSKLMMVQSRFRFIDSKGNRLKEEEYYHYIKTGHICDLSTIDMCKFAGSGFTMSFRAEVVNKVISNNLDKYRIFPFHDILIGLMSVAIGDCIMDRNVIDNHRIHENNVTKKKNKSFISGRTKQKQLDILDLRIEYFKVIAKYSVNENKKKDFLRYALFCQQRLDYIHRCNVRKLVDLFHCRDMYASKTGVIADTMYSIGLEKILLLLLKIRKV